MPNSVFLTNLMRYLRKRTNAETASAVRELAKDFADMDDTSTAKIKHPHSSAAFLLDIARRLEHA